MNFTDIISLLALFVSILALIASIASIYFQFFRKVRIVTVRIDKFEHQKNDRIFGADIKIVNTGNQPAILTNVGLEIASEPVQNIKIVITGRIEGSNSAIFAPIYLAPSDLLLRQFIFGYSTAQVEDANSKNRQGFQASCWLIFQAVNSANQTVERRVLVGKVKFGSYFYFDLFENEGAKLFTLTSLMK